MRRKTIAYTGAVGLIALAWTASQSQPASAVQQNPARELSTPTKNSDREAYFGDLHMHTQYSFDAYILGARLPIDDVYHFARGDVVRYMGHVLRRPEPLDFIAVTDHAEQMGFGEILADPSSPLAQSDIGHRMKAGERSAAFLMEVAARATGDKQLPAAGRSAWTTLSEAADRFYQPGKFTTFIGYEWSSTPDGQNLHRNIIFRGKAAYPFSSQDSNKPEDLWTYLEKNRARGIEALAIPHNANVSNGLMFDWIDSSGRPIDEKYAQRRVLNEPLTEIVQAKGQSETLPLLSSKDEFANFEVFDLLFGKKNVKGKVEGSYVRDAYGRGLEIASKNGGANPYKFGMAGGSDLHGGFSISSEGQHGGDVNDTAQQLTTEQIKQNLGLAADASGLWKAVSTSSGALTAVWAEQNTRESIFDAFRRKETFATSGTRMKVRMFGGWNYQDGFIGKPGWIRRAYAQGVAMGSDLPTRPRDAKAPRFAVWAVKDPNGANLDRIQIVKVWLDGAKRREQVFDVAASGNRMKGANGKLAPVGNTVDLRKATYRNSIGSTSLQAVWSDPTFNAARPAVYYVRALEIPTPRWTTIQAVRRGLPLTDQAPATLQERAWSSPIWYVPATETN